MQPSQHTEQLLLDRQIDNPSASAMLAVKSHQQELQPKIVVRRTPQLLVMLPSASPASVSASGSQEQVVLEHSAQPTLQVTFPQACHLHAEQEAQPQQLLKDSQQLTGQHVQQSLEDPVMQHSQRQAPDLPAAPQRGTQQSPTECLETVSGSMRACRVCHTHKPLPQFYIHSGFADGLDTRCKACTAMYDAARRMKRPRVEQPTVNVKACRCAAFVLHA